MTKSTKLGIIILRMIVGWYFLYNGIAGVLDSSWSILPYIKNPGTFPNFYAWVADPTIAPYISFLIKGGFLLVGALLLTGIFVRLGTFLGMLLILFFYFPLLHFPYVGTNYIVDQNLILVAVLLFLFFVRAGEFFGLGTFFKFSRY